MDKGISIRPYNDSDYNAIKKILQQSDMYDKVWDSRKNLKKKIRTLPGSIILATDNGNVIGCVYAQTDGWEGLVWRLAVLKDYRKHGIGTKLLKNAEKFLKKKGVREVGMLVNSKNEELQKYYKQRGYITSGKDWKFYYTKVK